MTILHIKLMFVIDDRASYQSQKIGKHKPIVRTFILTRKVALAVTRNTEVDGS